MTTNFYAPPSAIKGSRVVLPEDEAHHLQSVLRAEEGDEIVVVDGEGGWHRVRLDHLSQGQAVGIIQETRHEVGEPSVHVTVGMGMLTKRSRFETFVEKAVELGVGRIVPMHTRHTEAETLRRKRIRNVMVAAMKQCRRSRLPALSEPQSFDAVVDGSEADVGLLCHGGNDATPIVEGLGELDVESDILVLVGPEGGFAPAEVTRAADAGCTTVSLGERRLRAETAGLAAVNAVTSLGAGRRLPV